MPVINIIREIRGSRKGYITVTIIYQANCTSKSRPTYNQTCQWYIEGKKEHLDIISKFVLISLKCSNMVFFSSI